MPGPGVSDRVPTRLRGLRQGLRLQRGGRILPDGRRRLQRPSEDPRREGGSQAVEERPVGLKNGGMNTEVKDDQSRMFDDVWCNCILIPAHEHGVIGFFRRCDGGANASHLQECLVRACFTCTGTSESGWKVLSREDRTGLLSFGLKRKEAADRWQDQPW